jgi:hypothetical protein
MIVCDAKIALPYNARYQFLLDMRSKKVAVAAQSKDNIDNDLDEENNYLANKIAGSAKKMKTLDGYFGPKMHQPTLQDCTPPDSNVNDDEIFGEDEPIVKTLQICGTRVNGVGQTSQKFIWRRQVYQ